MSRSGDDDEKARAEARYALDLVHGRVSKGELAVLTQARVGLLREELAALPLWDAFEDYLTPDNIAAIEDKIGGWSDILGLVLVDDPAFIPLAISDAGITYAYCHPRIRSEGGPTLVIAPGADVSDYRSTTSRDEEDILCRALPDADKAATWEALEHLYEARGWTLQRLSAQARRLALRITQEIAAARADYLDRYTP